MTIRLLEPLFYGVCLLISIRLLVHSFARQYSNPMFAESMLYPRVILIAWSLLAGKDS